MMKYSHSPKVIMIAGAPAAGKTETARRLESELGYVRLNLDGINTEIARQLGIEVKDLRKSSPAMVTAYKTVFIRELRANRYADVVLEGARMSHAHVYEAFKSAVNNAYGEYVIAKPFYLNPPTEVRRKQYLLRRVQLTKKVAKDKDAAALAQLKNQYELGFCEYLEPILDGYELVESADAILAWAGSVTDATHPALPARHADLIKAVAESGAYNPFYQKVEVDGETVIRGFTDSELSWRNISDMGVSFKGKKCCDIGCMLGYYSFKAEEAGGSPLGVDLDEGAIKAARLIAAARNSRARFEVYDVEQGFQEGFDLIFALNVLHRVSHFDLVCRNIFAAAEEFVLEVGEIQVRDVLTLSKEFGLKMRKAHKSHRRSSVVGQRVLLHLGKA